MSDLSAAASLPEDVLARGIRYGIANGLFRKIALNQIAHSSASAELHNNGHLRNVVHFGVQFLQKILMSIPSVMVVKEDKSTDKVPERIQPRIQHGGKPVRVFLRIPKT
jgi:hypothetical protein